MSSIDTMDSYIIEEIFALLPGDEDLYPLSLDNIAAAQMASSELKNRIKNNKGRKQFTKRFTHNQEVGFENNRNFTPKELRQQVLKWLCHPGHSRMEETLKLIMT